MSAICNFSIKIRSVDLDNAVNKVVKSVNAKLLNNTKVEKNLEIIKENILKGTENYINSHRKRPAEASKLHIIDVLRETSKIQKTDRNSWELIIGDQKVLDDKVPYWYVLNYGGNPWKGKAFFGIFQDGAPIRGGSANTWFTGGSDGTGKSFMMKPKHAIAPMHYINYMARQFTKELSKFKSKSSK
jgi:hypothetical protein